MRSQISILSNPSIGKEKKRSVDYMNDYEKNTNRAIGQRLKDVRMKHKMTQTQLSIMISTFVWDDLRDRAKLSEVEYQKLLDFSQEHDDILSCWDEDIQRKLKKAGITKAPTPIAVSTISNYENGNWTIPAYYIVMLQEILKDFIIL
jgi:transcriptional regulator with XRE-family HTH domain